MFSANDVSMHLCAPRGVGLRVLPYAPSNVRRRCTC